MQLSETTQSTNDIKPTVFWLKLKGQTKLCHHPPPAKIYPRPPTISQNISSTTHHQSKYIHHHPPPPTTSQNISTTTHHQSKYIHHHLPQAKIYPPPPTTSQNISTTTHHQPKYIHHHSPPPTDSQNLFYKKPIYKNH